MDDHPAPGRPESGSSPHAETSLGEPSDISIHIALPAGADRPWDLDRATLLALLRRIVDCAEASLDGTPVARLHLEVVDDAAMDQYHRRFSGVPGTTDVLTFLASEPGEPIDVDIVVSADEATRQAQARGHTTSREVILYTLHGLLHCYGFDDHDPAAYQRMHAEEDRILCELGIGVTFARDAAPDRDRGEPWTE